MKIYKTNNKSSGVNSCEYIVLHHTATGENTANGIINAFTGKVQRRTSAHYLIDEDGEVYKFGEDEDILWHAGTSEWKGKTGMNSYSIGIELIGPLKDGGFTGKQRESLKTLLNSLSKEHNIEKDNIIRHKDISPSRKWDIADTLWNGEHSSFEEYKTSLFAKIEPMEEERNVNFPLSENRCKKMTTINQSKIKENTKSCTHISSYNNYVYNGGAIEITDELINNNIIEAEALGLLGDNSGGNGAKNSKFLAEKLGSNYSELYTATRKPEAKYFLKKGYAVQVSISADIDYLKDLIDDLIINTEDYSKLKDGTKILQHRTNLIQEDDKYFIIDNFYGKKWNKYEIKDVDQFLNEMIKYEMFVYL